MCLLPTVAAHSQAVRCRGNEKTQKSDDMAPISFSLEQNIENYWRKAQNWLQTHFAALLNSWFCNFFFEQLFILQGP